MACVKSYPARPNLDARDWPYTRAELEACIEQRMEQPHAIRKHLPIEPGGMIADPDTPETPTVQRPTDP